MIKKIGDLWIDTETGTIFSKDPGLNSTMIPKFDLSTLGGVQLTFETTEGPLHVKILKAELIQEVIRAHTLLLNNPGCETTDILDLFTGFVPSPYHITWVTTSNPKLSLKVIAQQCINEGNTLAVIEIIPRNDQEDLGRN